MSISNPTFTQGAVLNADDLDAAFLLITNEINRLAALPHPDAIGNKNLLINGDFSIWQRGVSQTSTGLGSDDRWVNNNGISTKVVSQQTFTLGQTDVPNNPTYFSRTVVTSVAGASNYVLKTQRIEDVTRLAGREVTLSFWAKADSVKNISIEFTQGFGTGGSPSATVTGISPTLVALTTDWAQYTLTITLPNIVGKTIGTDGSHTSITSLNIWMDAGSDRDARTNSLGQQSGTFDISNIQLEFGDTATAFEYTTYDDQLRACQRYFERFLAGSSGYDIGTAHYYTTIEAYSAVNFKVTKRIQPSMSISSQTAVTAFSQGTPRSSSAVAFDATSIYSSGIYATTTAVTVGQSSLLRVVGVGEYIDVDAEL